MRIAALTLTICVFAFSSLAQTVPCEENFIDRTLGIDYYHVGNVVEETITIDRIYQQGIRAGNPRHLHDPFGMGCYALKV